MLSFFSHWSNLCHASYKAFWFPCWIQCQGLWYKWTPGFKMDIIIVSITDKCSLMFRLELILLKSHNKYLMWDKKIKTNIVECMNPLINRIKLRTHWFIIVSITYEEESFRFCIFPTSSVGEGTGEHIVFSKSDNVGYYLNWSFLFRGFMGT